MTLLRVFAILVGTIAADPGFAQAPAAIVEDATGSPPGIEFMDYVESGRVIRLAPRDTIVLSYLKSCVREVITGGTVTVGVEQSDVRSGEVARTAVPCEAGKMLMVSGQTYGAAGLAFRGSRDRGKTLGAQMTLYGSSPIIELMGGGVLTIQRLDRSGEAFEIPISTTQLVRRAFFDFAAAGKSLAPGGVYRASWDSRQVVFRIDPAAKPGRTPIIGRLFRLEPAG